MELSTHRSFVINIYVITIAWHCISPWSFYRSLQKRREIDIFHIFQQISAHSEVKTTEKKKKKGKPRLNARKHWESAILAHRPISIACFMTFGTKEVFIIRSRNDIVYDSVITTFAVVIVRRRCLAVRIDCCTVSCTLSISNFPLYLWTIFEQEFQSIRTRIVAWWTESQRKLYQVLRARGRSLLPQRTSHNSDFCSWFFSDQKRESCRSDSRQKGCKVVRILSSSDQPAIV